MRSFAERILRRTEARPGLAESAISSSERMAAKISSSSRRMGYSARARPTRCGVSVSSASSFSPTSVRRTERAVCISRAQSKRSLGERIPPTLARATCACTSSKAEMGCTPVRATSVDASSVSACIRSISRMSLTGTSAAQRALPRLDAARSTSMSRIL